MKLTNSILSILILFAASCKCDETHIIEGKIINGTNGEPYVDEKLTFRVYKRGDAIGLVSTERDNLGNTRTDSTGHFTFSYDCTDINGVLEVSFNPYGVDFAKLERNTDINQTFYCSDSGTIKINLKPSSSIKASDTLFILQFVSDSNGSIPIVDTIIGYQPGYYKTIRTKASRKYTSHHPVEVAKYKLYWGKGSKEFYPTKDHSQKPGFWAKHYEQSYLKGDPFIDEITIEY